MKVVFHRQIRELLLNFSVLTFHDCCCCCR